MGRAGERLLRAGRVYPKGGILPRETGISQGTSLFEKSTIFLVQ